MARFDVYTFSHGVPYVIDVQADIFADIGSRVVIPLVPATSVRNEAMPRLKPILRLADDRYALITTDIVTVRKRCADRTLTCQSAMLLS